MSIVFIPIQDSSVSERDYFGLLRTLIDWSRCQGSSNCSSIIEFLSSLRIVP